ncbi:hypothetical protein EON65_52175 [archaeon]|nr:MAG: hypothetical protein EON65_52175 [archaeon]
MVKYDDGTFEIFESSAKGLEQLKRDREALQSMNIDLAELPSSLKCVRSGQPLREAIELPCCHRVRYVTLNMINTISSYL